jgi:hypothetical protein
MPTLLRMMRRRLLLAGLLLAGAALVAYPVLTASGPLDAARAKYDRMPLGMNEKGVERFLAGWSLEFSQGGIYDCDASWYDPKSGATISLHYHVGVYDDFRLTGKHFDEGDQSFRAKVGRLKDRLADKLHHGP